MPRRDTGFGKRLKHAMQVAWLGVRQLAELEGVNRVTVSRWRKGDLPAAARITSLARRLRTTAEWLLSNRGKGPRMASTDDTGRVNRLPTRPASDATAADLRAVWEAYLLGCARLMSAGNGNGLVPVTTATQEVARLMATTQKACGGGAGAPTLSALVAGLEALVHQAADQIEEQTPRHRPRPS